MPKNFGGKKKSKTKDPKTDKKNLEIREEGEEYAQVSKMLGNGRLLAQLVTKSGKPKEIQCSIRGKMRRGRRQWIEVGDWVLVTTPEYSNEAWVISKYQANEVQTLKKMGEIVEPDKKTVSGKKEEADEDNPFVFDDGEDGEDSEAEKPPQSTTVDLNDDDEVDFDEI